MKFVVWDTEGDDLFPSKFYCLAYHTSEGEKRVLTEYKDIQDFFKKYPDHYYVAHNCHLWDLFHLNRVIGIEKPKKIIDTMFLSFYINHSRPKNRGHGLENYGEDFGVPKPKISSWKDLPLEEYINRCIEDVKINLKLFEFLMKKMRRVYTDEDLLIGFLKYLDFKASSAALHLESPWKIDLPRASKALENLERIKGEQIDILNSVLPDVPVIAKRKPPKNPTKADGSLSQAGIRWRDLCEKAGVPPSYDGIIEEVVGYKPPNGGSSDQIKDWLYSLGWKPETFKEVKRKDGRVDQVPQINLDRGGGVCPSVLRLKSKSHGILALDGIGVLTHRIGILNGFIRNADENGRIVADIVGLTNTLRFKHSGIVNLPKPGLPYAEDIRACLICEDNEVLCGSDQSSLEDRTKQHYMMPYDPEYVAEMNTKDFDPHIDIAVLGNLMSPEEGKEYKHLKATDKNSIPERLEKLRDLGKTTNYAGVYGAGAPRISKTAGITLQEAKALHKTYWERNWSVKAVAEAQEYKEVDGELWLKNPVSGFWMSLRYVKDIFSTLNQSTGVFCFDVWISCVLRRRRQKTAEFHDEGVWVIPEGREEEFEEILRDALEEANEILQLNRRLDIDVKFGKSYDKVH